MTEPSAICLTSCDSECIEMAMHTEKILSMLLTILTLVISIYNIYMHLIHFNNPFFQSKIIGICFPDI